MSYQLLLLKMLLHHLQDLHVFLAGWNCAVVFIIPHTINIVCAGIQKRNGGEVARNAIAKVQRIKIMHCLLQSRAVALFVIVLIQQLRNQQLAVMSVENI